MSGVDVVVGVVLVDVVVGVVDVVVVVVGVVEVGVVEVGVVEVGEVLAVVGAVVGTTDLEAELEDEEERN